MIKPVTFQAAQNFKANLYALEVRSRFADQNNANGYYADYEDEFAWSITGTSMEIGSGALLVQGRMVEIIGSETVSIPYTENYVGYIICRIETKPAANAENCSFIARTGASLSAIPLMQQDTYAYNAERTNRIYELPLYSFAMQNSQIANVKRIMEPIVAMGHYPIGSIYMSVNSTSPASIFGGTWSAWGTGRVPVGINTSDSNFNTVEKTGGESAHTLNMTEIPSHAHSIQNSQGINGMNTRKINYSDNYPTGNGSYEYINITSYAGGGGAHNNLQPYIVCYMWKRIA